MSRNSSLYTAFLCVLCCSAAVALQPSVRAGSISLNSGVKPVANTTTSTSSTSSSTNTDASRGSTLSKFSQAVVPVSRPNNNDNSGNAATSAALEELRQQIAELRTAQLGLENNQITRSEMETTIENTVKNLDLTTANNDLKTKLSDINSSNQTLQSDLSSLRQSTEAFSNNLDETLDNRLRVRGVLSNTDLSDKIREDLISREILTNSGALNVEKKGEVQVTEASVTDALRNSDNFKQLVSDEVATKGYLTDSSDTITNLARKSDALTAKVDGDVETEGSLLYKIKHDEQIRNDLKGDPGQDGSSVSAEEVANALKGDSTFVKGITGKDANSIWYEYCNSGTNLTSIIQYLYPSVTNCDDFTSEQYNALTTGPKGQCLVWALKSEDLNPSDGIGARLTKIFGNNIIANLQSYKVNTRVTLSSESMNFVNACEKSYDKIMAAEDPITVEMAYCKEQAKNYPDGTTNLTIIQKLYPQVTNCNQFTSSMYTAITNGAKGYCLSLAQDPDNLTADSGIGAKLVELFGEGVIEDLKRSFAETYVSVRGAKAPRNFIDACIDNYDAIMAGKDAKSVEQVYCESNSANANISNLSIIQKFYPSVQNCSQFETYMYTAITSGAKGYCLSLAQNPNDLSSDSGIGAKLVRLFGDDIIRELNNNTVNTYVSVNGAKAVKSFLEACEENYDAIMSGKDAKTTEELYCESQAKNYPEGTTNLTIIQKLYPTVQDCSQFTIEMYSNITSGAKGYCLSLAQKPEDLTIDSTIGKRLIKLFGDNVINDLQRNFTETTVSVNGAKAPKNFLEACEENYNAIMSGEDAKTTEELYCEAQAKNYPDGTTNLYIIQKLYPVVQDCSQFTIEMYSNIMGGAKGYCLSLAQKPEDITLDTAIGKRLVKLFGDNVINDLKRDFADTTVSVNGAKAPKSFLEACEENYNAIMAGEDAKSVEQTYCEANFATVNALYSEVSSIELCADNTVFTSEKYNAMMEGAKAYCLLIAKDFSAGKLSVESGIGKKLDRELKIDGGNGAGIFSLMPKAGNTVNLSTVLRTTKFNNNQTFLQACEEKYNKIMSGDDGEDAKSVEQTYCEANFATVSALYSEVSSIELCADNTVFTSEKYNAMMEGAKAYCLLIAKDFSAGKLSVESGIGKKLDRELKIDGGNGAGIFSLMPKAGNTVNLSTVLRTTKFNNNQTFLQACEEKYNKIMSGDDGEDAKSAEQSYCEANSADVIALFNNDNANPRIRSVSDCPNFTAEQYKAMTSGAKAYCLLLAKDFSAGKLTLTASSETNKAIARKMNEKLKIGSSADGILSMSDKSLSKVLTTKFNGTTDDFLAACEKTYNEIMAGDKGDNGNDGESAAYTWCKAHVVATGFRTTDTVKKMSAAKTLNAFAARGNIVTGLTKANNEGYFTSIDACLAAVEADPSLMGGETAEETKYNSDVAKGDVVFEISTAGRTAFNANKAGYIAAMKGAKGDNGNDGKTWRPSFSNGQISWEQSTDASTINNFDVATTAVNAVKTQINTSGSDLANAITSKANAAATSQAVTMTDLVNYINNGLFQVNNGSVVLNTNITTSGLTSGEAASIQKLSGAGSSSTASQNFGTISSPSCNNGTCSVTKSTGSSYDYQPISNP